MFALAEDFIISPDAEIAEALAVLRGLTVARQAGYTSIILEGDAQNVLQDLVSKNSLYSSHGIILEDARQVMQMFSSISVATVRRNANKVVHTLAHLSKSLNGEHLVVDSIPTQIMAVLAEDCNSLITQ